MHDLPARLFVRKFLGADEDGMSSGEARSALVASTKMDHVSSSHLIQAGQIIFHFALLDTCADVFGLGHHQARTVVPRTPTSGRLVDRLQKVSLSNIHSAYRTVVKIDFRPWKAYEIGRQSSRNSVRCIRPRRSVQWNRRQRTPLLIPNLPNGSLLLASTS